MGLLVSDMLRGLGLFHFFHNWFVFFVFVTCSITVAILQLPNCLLGDFFFSCKLCLIVLGGAFMFCQLSHRGSFMVQEL